MNELTKTEMKAPINVGEVSIFSNMQKFQDVQFMADYLSKSDMVPREYQGKPANVLIALSMAERMKADPMMVMQSLYIVHGKPSWSAQFLIGLLNSSGRFSPLQHEFIGTEGKEDWGCIAFATDLSSGEVVRGPKVTMKIAKDEGWLGRNGSKWKTMPELMLTYRSSAFFIRAKAPELSMGMHTEDEVRDMGMVEVVQNVTTSGDVKLDLKALKAPKKKEPAKKVEKEVVVEEELIDDTNVVDNMQFYKQSIDSCGDYDSLMKCGKDIGEDEDLSKTELDFVRGYFKAAKEKFDNGLNSVNK